MLDSLIVIPNAPAGTEPAVHYRALIAKARTAAEQVLAQLHAVPVHHLRDEAADASTGLRRLREIARQVIDQQLDDEEQLVTLLGAFDLALEVGEHALMTADLRTALAHDPAAWELVLPNALAIGEMAGAACISFLLERGYDIPRLDLTQDQDAAAIRHAIQGALVAGFVQGCSMPLVPDTAMHDLECLLGKTIEHMADMLIEDALRHLRFAAVTNCALWNLARIAQRDMPKADAAAIAKTRAEQLDELYAATGVLASALTASIDYEYCYDVGLAYGSVEPLLTQLADSQDATMPGRANPAAWLNLFAGAPALR